MMKLYSTFSVLFATASIAVAQKVNTNQYLVATVVSGSVKEFKAVNALVAANRIESGANVHYVAGQSITLQPGFTAAAGAMFSATVEAVTSKQDLEADQSITVVVYPNPFSDVVSIGYNLPASTAVKQTLTDIRGQVIRETGGQEAEEVGSHRIEIKGESMPTGVYFLQLQTNTERRVIRLLKK